MSNIKPTGANATSPVDPLGDAAPAAASAPTTGSTATATAAPVANPSEAVISALREGRVTLRRLVGGVER